MSNWSESQARLIDRWTSQGRGFLQSIVQSSNGVGLDRDIGQRRSIGSEGVTPATSITQIASTHAAPQLAALRGHPSWVIFLRHDLG
jgi:hypothetical protein